MPCRSSFSVLGGHITLKRFRRLARHFTWRNRLIGGVALLALTIAIYALELLVAFLQADVFGS